MSNPRRPSKKPVRHARPSAPRPAATPVAAATAAAHCAPLPSAPPTSLSESLERHRVRMARLLDQAGRVTETMFNALEYRLVRGEEVYPGECTQLCRAMQILAKCGAELDKQQRLAAGTSAAQEEELTGRTVEMSDEECARFEAAMVPILRIWEQQLIDADRLPQTETPRSSEDLFMDIAEEIKRG